MTMDIKKELMDIGKILGGAGLLSKVKKETSMIASSAEVTDGSHGNVDFEVIVRCASKDFVNISRRLSSSKDMSVERITDNMIGVRRSHV